MEEHTKWYWVGFVVGIMSFLIAQKLVKLIFMVKLIFN